MKMYSVLRLSFFPLPRTGYLSGKARQNIFVLCNVGRNNEMKERSFISFPLLWNFHRVFIASLSPQLNGRTCRYVLMPPNQAHVTQEYYWHKTFKWQVKWKYRQVQRNAYYLKCLGFKFFSYMQTPSSFRILNPVNDKGYRTQTRELNKYASSISFCIFSSRPPHWGVYK